MAEDMSDIISKLSGMLGKENIPDNIQEIMGNLVNNDEPKNTDTSSGSDFNIDIDTILKMQSVMSKMNSKDDPRATLLLSLKPYLNSKRKSNLDQYVKLLNMTKLIDVFNMSGGDGNK